MRRSWSVSRILAVICLAVASPVLFAQALPTATGPGSYVSVGAGVSGYHLEYGERWLGAPEGWVDANMTWRLGLEGEVRSLRYNQDLGTHANTYLAGPRLSLLPGRLEPYVKVLAGTTHFHFPYSYAHGTYFAYAGGGGLDVHLSDRLQVRLLDVEYQRWPGFTFGPTASYGVSAGISFTLHRSVTRYVR